MPESSAVNIEIYSTAGCPYCERAKRLLDKKGAPYTEFRIDKERGLRDEMISRSQRTTVPQVFIDGKHIGGFDDLAELDVDGELDELLGIS
jgi:glutaredoxin 3